MKAATVITIETVLEADRSIPKTKREQVMDILLDRNPSSTPRKKDQITAKQAAESIGVHVVTLRRYVKQGLVKEIRITDRKIRFDKREIISFANGERRDSHETCND